MAGNIIGELGMLLGGPLGTAASVGKLVADIIHDLTGHPSDAEVIADALRDGLYRLAEAGDGISEAILLGAQAEFVRAQAELISARARFLEAKTAHLLARTELERLRAMRQRDTAMQELQILLPRLRAFMEDYDVLVGVPLRRLPPPSAQ